MSLLSVENALQLFKDNVNPTTAIKRVPASESLGFVLAEDVCSTLNVPPEDCSAMDGYALCTDDLIAVNAGDSIRYRFTEFGPRTAEYNNDVQDLTLSLTGESENFDWDFSYNFNRYTMRSFGSNYVQERLVAGAFRRRRPAGCAHRGHELRDCLAADRHHRWHHCSRGSRPMADPRGLF